MYRRVAGGHLHGYSGKLDWFDGSIVTYRLSAKQRLLGIEPASLERFEAVSEPVARTMAIAALERSSGRGRLNHRHRRIRRR